MAKKPFVAKAIRLEKKSKEQLIPEMAKFSRSRLKYVRIISFIFKGGAKLFLNLDLGLQCEQRFVDFLQNKRRKRCTSSEQSN